MHKNNCSIFLDSVSEPSNRAAVPSLSGVIKELQHKMYRSGTTSMQLLDEPYKSIYKGIVFKSWTPLLETFNKMLAKMEANGMMAHWRQFQEFSTTKLEEIGPQVLTMDHLELGFLACCIPIVLAAIAFIGELAWSRLVIGCRRSSKSSNFEQIEMCNCSETSRRSSEDSNIERVQTTFQIVEEFGVVAVEMCNFDQIAASEKSLEDSNESRVVTTFPLEKLDGNAIEMSNVEKMATCSQIDLQVKFVDDTRISIEESCVDNVAQGQDERDDIDDLIDQIVSKSCVEINQIV